MSLIIKKDVGFGVPLKDAYVKFDVIWNAQEPNSHLHDYWAVTVAVYLNKAARQQEILKDWVKLRCKDIRTPIPMDDKVAQELNLHDLQSWNTRFSPGPWNTLKDQLWIRKNYLDIEVRPVQTFTWNFEPIALPTLRTMQTALATLYELATFPDSPAWVLINSRSLSDRVIENSIKVDMDTSHKTIQQAGQKQPLLLERRDTETSVVHGIKLL